MEQITLSTAIAVRVESVWNAYHSAEDIKIWCLPSAAWQCSSSVNDLRIGGKFQHLFQTEDGRKKSRFEGSYTSIEPFRKIGFIMPEERSVLITFSERKTATMVSVSFTPDLHHPLEEQGQQWENMLLNFKNYVEKIYGIHIT